MMRKVIGTVLCTIGVVSLLGGLVQICLAIFGSQMERFTQAIVHLSLGVFGIAIGFSTLRGKTEGQSKRQRPYGKAFFVLLSLIALAVLCRFVSQWLDVMRFVSAIFGVLAALWGCALALFFIFHEMTALPKYDKR